ncbi:dfp2-like protein 31 [Dermatophagoides farinae]|uniref:Dfp2-like protein 31 n=1 Tax=Dermatophagoides farinae TaxID=6954 RepID=A0A9D4P4Y9_DERFA|nr:chitinase 5-like [Dermatophagoides farinae]KAH7644178.1 dfp2-like protein 31 [Dermatophagoides farinae]
MFNKIGFVCLALIATTNAYSNSGSGYSNYGSSSGSLSSYGGYGNVDGGGGGGGVGGGGDQKSYGSSLDGMEQPQVIEVSPDQLPVQVHFRTASSRLNVQQSHGGQAMPQVEHASFQDDPQRIIHQIVKPVIQEVREIIQPYRRVTQEIRPVIEEVHTVVHKGENRRPGSGLQGKGAYGGGGGGGGGQYAKSKAAAKA